jgi:hypothetical protein
MEAVLDSRLAAIQTVERPKTEGQLADEKDPRLWGTWYLKFSRRKRQMHLILYSRSKLEIDPGVHFRPSGIQFRREKRYKSGPFLAESRVYCADVGAVVSPFGRFGKATQLRKELEPGLHEATIPFCV